MRCVEDMFPLSEALLCNSSDFSLNEKLVTVIISGFAFVSGEKKTGRSRLKVLGEVLTSKDFLLGKKQDGSRCRHCDSGVSNQTDSFYERIHVSFGEDTFNSANC